MPTKQKSDEQLSYYAENLMFNHDIELLTQFVKDMSFEKRDDFSFFTEEDFTFTSDDYNMAAVRLDTNKEFSDFQTGEIKGEVLIKDE